MIVSEVLPKTVQEEIEIKCDVCGEHYFRSVSNHRKTLKNNENRCLCRKCSGKNQGDKRRLLQGLSKERTELRKKIWVESVKICKSCKKEFIAGYKDRYRLFCSEDCRKNPFGWTDEKTNRLIELYPNTSTQLISTELGCKKSLIVAKARRLKLQRSEQFERKKTEARKELLVKRNKTILGRDLTFDLLKEIALKYKSRAEFQTKDGSAYQVARNSGFLEAICGHMAVCSFSIPQMILQDIMDGILGVKAIYNSRKIIPPYEVDVYYPDFNLAFEYNGKGWHLDNKNDALKLEKFAEKKINIIYIRENNRKYEEDVKQQLVGNLDKINKICNKSITESDILNYKVGDVFSKIYNKEDLLNVAKSYSSFRDFKDKEKKVYHRLWKMKLIDTAIEHMRDKPRRPRTIDDISAVVGKYTTLKDFIKNDMATYGYIMKHKLLHLIKHLESSHRWKKVHQPQPLECN